MRRRCGRRRRAAPPRAARRAPPRSRPRASGTTSHAPRARAAARAAPASVARADHEAAEQRRGHVVGMPLERAARARTAARRARTCGRPRRGPPTIAAALDPRPAASGISERIVKRSPSAGCSRSNARTHRFVRSSGTPGTSQVDRELAGLLHLELECRRQRGGEHVVAGPEVRRGAGHADDAAPPHRQHRPLDALDVRLAGHDARRRGSCAVCGSFSPWPVSTQTTRALGAVLEQAGDGRGRGRLAEHALARAEQRVGVEDLLVARPRAPRRATR